MIVRLADSELDQLVIAAGFSMQTHRSHHHHHHHCSISYWAPDCGTGPECMSECEPQSSIAHKRHVLNHSRMNHKTRKVLRQP